MVLAIRLAALWREQANRPAFWLSCLLFTTLMTTFFSFIFDTPGMMRFMTSWVLDTHTYSIGVCELVVMSILSIAVHV